MDAASVLTVHKGIFNQWKSLGLQRRAVLRRMVKTKADRAAGGTVKLNPAVRLLDPALIYRPAEGGEGSKFRFGS